MIASPAKIDANRRNAQKSTGPRTEEGKNRSKMNATKHGCRAESLIIKDEDEAELEARKEAWIASLSPQTDAEIRAVVDAVAYSWRQDRARRAEVALVNARRADHDAGGDTTIKQQVVDLAGRLYLDRLGPIELYPTGIEDFEMGDRSISTSLPGAGKLDPDDPAILVLQLQATLEGCEWLLGEWGKLKKSIDLGQRWTSPDKLRAVRLLGKQPLDAIDDDDVALVFLASFVLGPAVGKWHWEIRMELIDDDMRRFRSDATTRQLEARLKPADSTAAQAALLALIERVTKPLQARVDAFRERDRIKAALDPDLLAFDPSVEAERLRRHELASGRGMARALDTLFKLRRQSSVVSGQLPQASSPPGNVTNEATDSTAVIVATSYSEGSFAAEAAGAANTNEATVGQLSVVRGQSSDDSAPREMVTNEATGCQWSIVSGQLSEGASRREPLTNEASLVQEIATNEPTGDGESRAPVEGGANAQSSAGQDAPESYADAMKRIRRTREGYVRKLNEQARAEAEAAMATRRAHRASQRRQTSRKDIPQNAAAREVDGPERGSRRKPAAPNTERPNRFAHAVAGPSAKAHSPPDR